MPITVYHSPLTVSFFSPLDCRLCGRNFGWFPHRQGHGCSQTQNKYNSKRLRNSAISANSVLLLISALSIAEIWPFAPNDHSLLRNETWFPFDGSITSSYESKLMCISFKVYLAIPYLM
ncbi:hypothetical protein KP509_29G002900 [Ceratopteris richardii]|uniref:Uncharacterized protein n=1 Tax=Ceratopteris richardii TaxID=49495 RepID=A0A8T2R498_CERRI|nr:hypothetical protein KP509_29G002900 [Ceratopteris richardii]